MAQTRWSDFAAVDDDPQPIDWSEFEAVEAPSSKPATSRGGYLTETARGLTQFVPAAVKTASTIGEKLLDRPALGVGPSGRVILRNLGVETDGVPESRPLYRAGEWMDRKLEAAYPSVPEAERNLGHDVVRGLGQVGSMVAGGLGAKAAGATVKGAALVGTALGFSQEFDDAFGRARQRGDEPDTALAKSLGYATVASLIENRFGAGRIIKKYFPDPVNAAKKLSALGVSKATAISLAVGFGEEGSQRFAQNWIVEEKPSFEGIVEEGKAGSIVQAIAELPAHLLRGPHGRIRSSLPRPERKPDEETTRPIISEEAAVRQPPPDQEVLGSQESQSKKQLGLRRVAAGDTESKGPAAAPAQEETPVASTTKSAPIDTSLIVGKELGFTVEPAMNLEGVDPEVAAKIPPMVRFTDTRKPGESPTASLSFSVPANASREQIITEFERAKKGFVPPVIPPGNAPQGPAPVAGGPAVISGGQPPAAGATPSAIVDHWRSKVEPALREFFKAFTAFSADRLEKNRIKPAGMSASDWIQKVVSQQPTWNKGRKTGLTAIQMLSQKNLWPTDGPEGEALRKSMLAAVKELRAAPGSRGDWISAQEQSPTQRTGTPAAPVAVTAVIPPGQSGTSTATGEKRVVRGLRARKIFDRETEANGPDILSWLAENMRMMSKSVARQTKGRDWWQKNQSLYDDSAPLETPQHGVIYGGNSMPDQVAQAAYEAGVLKAPGVNELWAAIKSASKRRAGAAGRLKIETALLEAEAAEQLAWQKATEKGAVRVVGEQLKVGDVMDVEGERTEVVAVDPETGDATLKDGKRFGSQTVGNGQVIYVEKFDEAESSDDFAPQEPKFKEGDKVIVGEMSREGTISAHGPYKDGEHWYFVNTNLGREIPVREADLKQPPSSGFKAGDFVKLQIPGPGGLKNIAGTVTRIMPDGKVEVRTQQDGYQTVGASALTLAQPAAPLRPLTEAEQSEFQALSIKARAAREAGGAQLTGVELRRYQDLEKLAGAQDLPLETGKQFKPAGDLSLSSETAVEKPPEKPAAADQDLFDDSDKFSLNRESSDENQWKKYGETRDEQDAALVAYFRSKSAKRSGNPAYADPNSVDPVGRSMEVGTQLDWRGVEILERLFGKRVVAFTDKIAGAYFGGGTGPELPDVIFVNAQDPHPLVRVVAHEMLHQLRFQRPDLYRQIYDKLKNDVDWQKALTRYQADYAVPEIAEEVLADFLGDQITEPKFWERFAKTDPSLFERVATAFIDWINQALEFIKGSSYGSSKLFRDVENARNVMADALAQYAKDTGPTEVAPGEGKFSLNPEQRKVHQVLGIPMGADKTAQPMQPIKDFVRLNYFDGTQPIAPENTERARDLIRRMADPAEKGLIIQEISEVAGPDMQAVGTMLVNELADYATRLALTGDLSLGREVVRNWHQFGELPAGSGKAAIGRALRAVQEAVSYRFYQTAYEMLSAGSDTARRAAGIGEELWQRLITAMRDARIDLAQFDTTPFDGIIPTTTPEQQTERERVTLEQEGQEAESKTEQYAQRLANRLELTEWPGNTAKTNEVKRVINEFLKSQPPLSQTLSVMPLAQALVGVGVTPETANRLAYDIFMQRERQWAGARVKAMRRAAARKGNLRALIEEIQATPYLAQKDAAWRKQTAEEWFMSAGLSREQAQEAAKLFDAQFQAALKKAAQVEAERLLDSGKLSPATKDTILRAIRSGLMDPANEWYGELLKAEGISPLTDADFKQLAELDQKLSNPDLSTPEKSEITDQIFTIWRRLGAPPDILTRLASNLVVTNLTGLPTAGVNIFAPQTLNFLELGLTALSSPRDFGVMLKAMIDAGKTWLSENKFSLSRDAYSFINNDFVHSQNTLKGLWERGLRQIKGKQTSERTKGAINMIFGAQQYAMRFLSSLDNANGLMKRQTQLALYSSQAMRHLGFNTKEIQDVVDMLYLMKEQFYALGIEAGLSNNVAIVRSNDLAMQAFRDFLDNKVGDTLGSEIFRSAELDGYSILGRLGPNVQELDEGGLVSRTIGAPLLKLSNWMRQQPGLAPAFGVALLGYVNVPYRATRFAAWNSPYGLLRLGINKWRKSTGRENWWKQSLATEQQERYRLKQSLAGTAVLTLVTGLGLALSKTSADDGAGDDDDDGIYFTGAGPKNKGLRSAWMARGFKPNSMVFFFGGRYVAIPMTRAGEPLAHFAWILSARDQKAWRDKEAAATGRTIEPNISKEAGYAIGTYLGLMGQRGFLQTLFQAGQVSAGADDPRRFAASKGAGFVSGLVTPFLGLQRSVVNLLQGPADTSSISSAIAANVPVLGLVGDTFRKPLLNRLGDPLYNPEDSWYHKMYYTGVPIAFGVSDSSANKTAYGLMVEKGVAPPELRRSVVEEKYGPLDNEQFREFAETSGRLIKRELIANEPQLRNQTPEEVKKWINKTTASADKLTAIGMSLEPVSPPKSRASTAPAASILSAPSISSGRVAATRSRLGRIRSSLGGGRTGSSRTRLATMKVPRLKRGRVRGSMRRRGRIRSSIGRRRRSRIYS